MADPDEALIEAIRAAVREQAMDRFLHEALTPDARNWVAGFAARAAYAAMVEHLGLVEETERGRCEIDLWHHDDIPCERGPDKRRLVSRWTEVDHGSE